MQGKSYDTNEAIGRVFWEKVQLTLDIYLQKNIQNTTGEESKLLDEIPDSPIYGNPVLAKVRIGPGAFRARIMDAYQRRCSVSGERTLPVLEAAHIKSYNKAGPNLIRNGLLLRSDIHKLFDKGYITITQDFKVEVSGKIKEEFENGKDYYKFHGNIISVADLNNLDKPSRDYIDWHNVNVYRG